ncbi:hypothetical protein Purlil1_2507 [Purpureocillium lilacinum]|uniref:Uncharacterized protein n=1 Tax=Purpureocillium lilacinum TaxID=33203 RepID=A0ABR0CB20_PURLI|nr:hypothetical protein Purlil1_2507 [Purpureocillium lilacinum]
MLAAGAQRGVTGVRMGESPCVKSPCVGASTRKLQQPHFPRVCKLGGAWRTNQVAWPAAHVLRQDSRDDAGSAWCVHVVSKYTASHGQGLGRGCRMGMGIASHRSAVERSAARRSSLHDGPPARSPTPAWPASPTCRSATELWLQQLAPRRQDRSGIVDMTWCQLRRTGQDLSLDSPVVVGASVAPWLLLAATPKPKPASLSIAGSVCLMDDTDEPGSGRLLPVERQSKRHVRLAGMVDCMRVLCCIFHAIPCGVRHDEYWQQIKCKDGGRVAYEGLSVALVVGEGVTSTTMSYLPRRELDALATLLAWTYTLETHGRVLAKVHEFGGQARREQPPELRPATQGKVPDGTSLFGEASRDMTGCARLLNARCTTHLSSSRTFPAITPSCSNSRPAHGRGGDASYLQLQLHQPPPHCNQSLGPLQTAQSKVQLSKVLHRQRAGTHTWWYLYASTRMRRYKEPASGARPSIPSIHQSIHTASVDAITTTHPSLSRLGPSSSCSKSSCMRMADSFPCSLWPRERLRVLRSLGLSMPPSAADGDQTHARIPCLRRTICPNLPARAVAGEQPRPALTTAMGGPCKVTLHARAPSDVLSLLSVMGEHAWRRRDTHARTLWMDEDVQNLTPNQTSARPTRTTWPRTASPPAPVLWRLRTAFHAYEVKLAQSVGRPSRMPYNVFQSGPSTLCCSPCSGILPLPTSCARVSVFPNPTPVQADDGGKAFLACPL